MVPSPTPLASLSSKLGVCNLATPLISGTGKATDFKFGVYIYMANRNKSPLKILEKMERGRIQRLPNFWGYPYYLGNGQSYGTSNLAGTFSGTIRMKAYWKFRRKGSVGISGSAQIFWVPPIISGTGKATDFTFCMNIHRVNPNKSPWKCWE